MTSRSIAFALALFLALTTALAAAPAACCVTGESGDVALIALDCCASMVECPLRLKGAGPAVVQTDTVSAGAVVLFAVPRFPDLAEGRAHWSSLLPPGLPAADGPPLYRLHAQLLI